MSISVWLERRHADPRGASEGGGGGGGGLGLPSPLPEEQPWRR